VQAPLLAVETVSIDLDHVDSDIGEKFIRSRGQDGACADRSGSCLPSGAS
jgi:hypothetical protein